jgi:hypothetical protein
VSSNLTEGTIFLPSGKIAMRAAGAPGAVHGWFATPEAGRLQHAGVPDRRRLSECYRRGIFSG